MGESPSLKRSQFFPGKLLTPEDLALEQQYFREKLRRHNRSLHGFGIVSGLKVSLRLNQIVVESGMALDCEGNEIVIETTQMSPSAATESWHTAYVNIRYLEESSDPVTIQGATEASTVKESCEIVLSRENLNRGHRHVRARWLACGQAHPLTIAKLRRSARGWRVERRYRAPSIK